MLQWWFGWHGIDPLRYACWDCYDHYGIDISYEDMAKIKNPATSIPEKCYIVMSHITSPELVGIVSVKILIEIIICSFFLFFFIKPPGPIPDTQ